MDKHRCMGCMRMISEETCPHCGFSANQDNEYNQLPVGTLLRGQYLVGRVLGQGGFGITYIGLDTYLDMVVAIKEFYPANAVNRNVSQSNSVWLNTNGLGQYFLQGRDKFLQEGRTLAKLRNIPEIVSVHSLFAENNTAYIVMEYIQGIDLRHYVRKKGGKIAPGELFPILKPVFLALDAVHTAGLVHRDISPDNIMLTADGTTKLLDFGAARDSGGEDADIDMSHSTEAIVKHGFAPAEQYRKRGNLGPWTDEYGLCATIYYCLTGSVPPDALVRMTDDIQPNWDIPGLTAQQRNALERGMSTRAKERFGSMKALYDNLYGETHDASPAPEHRRPEHPTAQRVKKNPPSAGSTTTEHADKRKPSKLLVGIVAAFTLAAGIFFAVGSGSNRDDLQLSLPSSPVYETENALNTVPDTTDATESTPQISNPYADSLLRISSDSPCQTSLLVADALKSVLGIDKFRAVVITGSVNYTHALNSDLFTNAVSGAYLANCNSAPILFSCADSTDARYAEQQNAILLDYIHANLEAGGKVYILGDSSAVPLSMEESLDGYSVMRIAGSSCYESNLAVLTETGVAPDQTVLVCNAEGSAGSILSSALGFPVLLVKGSSDGLDPSQADFLKGLNNNYCIVGGTASVSASFENDISRYGDTVRLTGKDRFAVSIQVGEHFFQDPGFAMLVYHQDYFSALCCSTLAHATGAPILFADASNYALASEYATNANIHAGFVIGSQADLPDEAVHAVFSTDAAIPGFRTDIFTGTNSDSVGDSGSSELAIPENAITFNGHSYYLFNDGSMASYKDAQAYCESLGGYLAVISSDEENSVLFDYVMSQGYNLAYFGFSDELSEGEWIWAEQERSDYTNWRPGQPNDGRNGNYAQFVRQFSDGPGNGQWSDGYWGGYMGYAFLCEWPAVSDNGI